MTPPRARRRGVLVVIEGIDGVGKSTLQRRLARRWRSAGFPVRLAREPFDPVLGRRAQELAQRDPWTSALLFTVDRLAGRDRIEAALSRGEIVLQDRSFYSTLAYQGSALAPPLARRLEELELRLAHFPDRVILLDLPRSEAISRLQKRGGRRAPLERARTLDRVRRSYRSHGRRLGWLVLGSDVEPGALAASVDRALRPWLRRRIAPRGPGR